MSFDPARLEVPPVEIRPLQAGDFDQVFALAESLAEAPHWPRARYQDLLVPRPSRPRLALVARDPRSREVLGFVLASFVPPEAELESIAVAGQAQRRGIGRRLLASLVTRLRPSGIRDLHLEVRASNQAAIHFYRSQNFNQTGVRSRYYADPEEDAVLMTLRLEALGQT
jgi:[ribosomal protein S18]-alanine N-acetyltransferase